MDMSKLSIVFMGTPEFAVPSLVNLHESFGIKVVVTVPDKPKGRGLQLLPSAVKLKALELKIPVLQPDKLNDESFINEMKSLAPDIIIVIAFRILPFEIYSLAKLGAFNIHGSILPKYRGAAPINHAILNGEKTTGLTSFLLEKKVDTGSILLTEEIEIPEGSTAGDLHDLLMPLSAKIAVKTVDLLIQGEYKLKIQDESLASPAPKIFPEYCKIDYYNTSEKVRNFIHGMSPFPGAWCNWEGNRFKILRTNYSTSGGGNPGKFTIKDKTMEIECLQGIITPLEIQLQGKKAMTMSAFLSGYRGEPKGSFS